MGVLGWVDVWKSSGEVMPRWIFMFDKTNFLFAMPRFDLFFAGYCVPNVAEEFEMYQAEDSIASGKAWDGSEAVLQDTGVEIAGDSGVEAARAAREDVDGVGARHGKRIGLQRIPSRHIRRKNQKQIPKLSKGDNFGMTAACG